MTKAITGIEADLNNYVAPEGELLYTIDSQKLKVGNGRDAGGILASNFGKNETIHVGTSSLAIKDIHNNTEIHLESTGNLTIGAWAITTDNFVCRIVNTDAGADRTLTPSTFNGVYLREGNTNSTITSLTIKPNESYIISVTNNSGNKYLNIYPNYKNRTEVGTWTPTITMTASDPDISGATVTLYKAIYTKTDNMVNFSLSFGISNYTQGRYIFGTLTLPKTFSLNQNIVATTSNGLNSQFIPVSVINLFGTMTVIIGSSEIRLPSTGLFAINIIGSYETNEV